jgi:hypothetical protein
LRIEFVGGPRDGRTIDIDGSPAGQFSQFVYCNTGRRDRRNAVYILIDQGDRLVYQYDGLSMPGEDHAELEPKASVRQQVSGVRRTSDRRTRPSVLRMDGVVEADHDIPPNLLRTEFTCLSVILHPASTADDPAWQVTFVNDTDEFILDADRQPPIAPAGQMVFFTDNAELVRQLRPGHTYRVVLSAQRTA